MSREVRYNFRSVTMLSYMSRFTSASDGDHRQSNTFFGIQFSTTFSKQNVFPITNKSLCKTCLYIFFYKNV